MAEPKAKQTRRPAGPKANYLVYRIEDGELVVLAFSRKTDEVLTAMSDNAGAKVEKLMSQPGR